MKNGDKVAVSRDGGDTIDYGTVIHYEESYGAYTIRLDNNNHVLVWEDQVIPFEVYKNV